MMPGRNGSVSGGTNPSGRTMPTSIRPKKKPAPPRPPQPKVNRLQNSQSFNTAQDLSSKTFGNSRQDDGKDLINFSTPPGSPKNGRRNTVSQISTAFKEPSFSYRVGASIFYIKSPLKNSVSETPVQNPFSPPRPSVEAQKPIATATNLQSSINSAWNATPSAWNTQSNVTSSSYATSSHNNAFGSVTTSHTSTSSHSQFNQIRSSLENNNTIKSNYQPSAGPSPWVPAGASSSSNASSDRTSNSFSDFGGSNTHQPRYSNVPVVETGKKELTSTLSSGSGTGSKPTIIRPLSKTLSQMSDGPSSNAQPTQSSVQNAIKKLNKVEVEKSENVTTTATMQRNYYDLPPDDDELDEEEDLNDSSFASPPMPTEPPPPPPAEVVAVDEWVSSTMSVTDYPDTYSNAGETAAYAIALYDFFPEADGDLQLQAGDLVYLLRKIDDSWYYGSCGGMEGMLPSNFVNVVVPLLEDEASANVQPEDHAGINVEVLYDFVAETEGDLGLQAGDNIKVIGRINEDWLYGEKNGVKGQFPTAFVQEIQQDLPIITV